MKKIASKKLFLIGLPLILLVGVFFIGHSAAATTWATDVLTGLISIIISALGLILILVMKGLVLIATYQHFIDSSAVEYGWKIVRDLCNMFFVVILLIIAFGTILNLPEYSYKKWLPKLILMAILINFSKTICGLLIDVAQVVMLTFVNSFKDVAGANLIQILGINEILQIAQNSTTVSDWTVIGAYVLGLIYLVIAIITIVAMMAMLAMRLVMIWIYVVLSPLAYLLAAFPGGSKYSGQWWDEFTKNLIVGPVLAFFIWLSFAALQAGDLKFDTTAADSSAANEIGTTIQGGDDPAAASEASKPSSLIKFVIAIGMLLGGMKIAQEIGGQAGKLAGSVASKGNKLAIGAAAGVGLAALRTAKRKGGDLRDWASEKAGVDFNVVAGYKRYQEQVAANRQLRKTRIRKGTLEKAEEGKTWVGRKMALMSTGDVAWQNILDKKHNILTAGSPRRRDDALKEIDKQNEIKKKASEDIANINKDSSRIVTDDEHIKNKNKLFALNSDQADLEKKKKDLTDEAGYQDLVKKEKDGTIVRAEAEELAKKRKVISEVDDKLKENTAKRDEVQDTVKNSKVVASEYIKNDLIKENQEKITSKQETINAADDEIKGFTEVLRKNKLSEVQSARAEINAKLEGEASKHIANFSNPEQLIGIFKEAVEQQDEALMSAVYKKLAKTGNYNELNKDLGYGTGYEGMMKMNDYLQNEGGMTQQDAGALIAEVGEICKSVNHFEAYGTMSMNKAGQWKPTDEEDYEAAIFSEKSKLQVQQYVRSVNRLGQGSYLSGKPHTAENWELSKNSIALYASKDSSYAEDMKKTGNISAIQFIGSNPDNIRKLRDNGANAVADVIEDICRKAKNMSVANPVETIRNVRV